MANTTGNMGFKFLGYLPGFTPDNQIQGKVVSNANATAIYNGDPVVFSSGLIIAATNGTGQIDGIFQGCEYTDASGVHQWRPYLPASQTAVVYVMSSPGAMFLAQSNGTAITTSNINKNIGFVTGAGSTIGGGFSGYQLDAANVGTTSTFPFRIVNLLSNLQPSSVNGTDNTSNNNIAVVCFNSMDFKAGQTGV